MQNKLKKLRKNITHKKYLNTNMMPKNMECYEGTSRKNKT